MPKRKEREPEAGSFRHVPSLDTCPSAAEFHTAYVRCSLPVVIAQGCHEHWPAMVRWQHPGDYFAASAPAGVQESQITVSTAATRSEKEAPVYSGDPRQQDSIMMQWCATHTSDLLGIGDSSAL